ncbi:MAG: PQQ-dependent sugar dehydrogenase [Gammaproteobacteria bacterium]|nr:PQQ-dependent sugar dehydrogenase [Gammaproteobacteria bacterium]MDD9895555.1 PQQ-dependent sugar dehydrogenase [Gammaproteobacteria bacterium]MDD9958459.1 PQQ-dependent sugar dehydrogenase [Gammaproteobacteria bacterium]
MERLEKTIKGLVLALITGLCSLTFAQGGDDILALYERGQPFTINTFEVDEVRVVPLGRGLANPFDFAFRENGDILITERYTGKLRLIRNGGLVEADISGVPEVLSGEFRSGLLSVALHPEDDNMVYLSYHKAITVAGEEERAVTLVRARIQEDRLVDVTEIFQAEGLDRGIAATKLLFEPDGKLLMSIGGAYMYAGYGDYAQDPSNHYGKLLRLNDDGSSAADNPFIDSGEYLPEVYTVGHRNIIGMDYHPQTGELWATENGPQGGDEANIIQAGSNYGWPIVSYSRQYRGDWVSNEQWSEEFIQPSVIWWPSIAPAGIAFYSGAAFPEWQNNLFVGSMMEGRIPGTGHIERVVFNSRGEEIRREGILRELQSRITAVKQGPDGNLYVLVDEEDGALLRLEAAN